MEQAVPSPALLASIVAASNAVAATSSRSAKRDTIAALLRTVAPAQAALAVAWLSGDVRLKLNVGWAALRDARKVPPAAAPSLTLADVDAALRTLAATSGKGAAAARAATLRALFARATEAEQHFLLRLVGGELRQGALEGVMLDAVAAAAGLPPADVRRAAMFAGDLPAVAAAALADGAAALAGFALQPLRPLQPMLAQPAESVADALARLGSAAFEWKLDGARVQVHRDGDAVRVYSRALNDVTAAVPEVVDAVRALPLDRLVLDGEAIALKPDGAPQPFQVTMRRFGRRLDIEAMRAELPLAVFVFDALLLGDATLVDRPAHERFDALAAALPAALLVPRLVTADAAAAEDFYADALARGHEGVMAKSLDAPYAAGSRGGEWLKVKRARTLDLVVLAAEWGNGRRQGWLSNLHLGARDAANGGWVMLGKTFKGMTDELLQWQTRELLAREVSRDAYTVHVRPELVVEIAFNDLQASPHYAGGLALRFARVKGYRPDKRPDEADTIDTVREIFAQQSAAEPR